MRTQGSHSHTLVDSNWQGQRDHSLIKCNFTYEKLSLRFAFVMYDKTSLRRYYSVTSFMSEYKSSLFLIREFQFVYKNELKYNKQRNELFWINHKIMLDLYKLDSNINCRQMFMYRKINIFDLTLILMLLMNHQTREVMSSC